MQYDLCRHIKTNGTQCGSPALDHQSFCFFHRRLHTQLAAFRHIPTPSPSGTCHLQLSPLEDRDSIQAALSVIIHALAANQIEARRATALFYGLQLASMNAARLNSAPFPADVLVETTCDPDGLELALPGATRTITTNIADEVYDEGEVPEDEEDEDEKEEEVDEELEILRRKFYGEDYKAERAAEAAERNRLPSATYPPGTAKSAHS